MSKNKTLLLLESVQSIVGAAEFTVVAKMMYDKTPVQMESGKSTKSLVVLRYYLSTGDKIVVPIRKGRYRG